MQHFTIKPGKRLSEQAELGHNRWHPDIPFLSKVKPGEEIIIETLDFLDAQILDNDDCSDVRDVDLTRAHPLTGPFYVEGAEPGDLLVIDLLDIKPITPVGFPVCSPSLMAAVFWLIIFLILPKRFGI